MTFKAIGEKLGYSAGYINSLHNKSYRMLRHPARIRFLEGITPEMMFNGKPLLPYEERIAKSEAERRSVELAVANAKLARLKEQEAELQARIANLEAKISILT
jgi:hypothetical protein